MEKIIRNIKSVTRFEEIVSTMRGVNITVSTNKGDKLITATAHNGICEYQVLATNEETVELIGMYGSMRNMLEPTAKGCSGCVKQHIPENTECLDCRRFYGDKHSVVREQE